MVKVPFFSDKSKITPIKTTVIRVKAMGERELVDTLWTAVGDGRQLQWKLTSKAILSAKIAKSCKKAADEIKDSLKPKSKGAVAPVSSGASTSLPVDGIEADLDGFEEVMGIAAGEFLGFAGELGLNVPVLRQVVASIKLGIAVGKVGKSTYNLKQYYDAYKGIEDSEVAKLAGVSLKKLLTTELRERSIKVATCTFDLITSTADPSGSASGAVTAVAKLAFKLGMLYRSYKLVKDVNQILRERDRFNSAVFTRMPLLGCYLFQNVESSQLLGVFYDVDDTIDAETHDEVLGQMHGSVDLKAVEQKYTKSLKPLVKLANGRIEAAPYTLIVPANIAWAEKR